mgnify:FL=1
MRSETVVSVNHENRVSMVINGHKPYISTSTVPSIGKNHAVEIAKEYADATNAEDTFPPKVDLMIYEDSVRIFHLVWKVLLYTSNKDAEWLVIVDAHNGEVLEKSNTLVKYVRGAGRVFDPDPGTALQRHDTS